MGLKLGAGTQASPVLGAGSTASSALSRKLAAGVRGGAEARRSTMGNRPLNLDQPNACLQDDVFSKQPPSLDFIERD